MLSPLETLNPIPKMKKTPTKEPTKRLHPVALAIPTPLLETIREAARMMCVTQADVQRLAMEIGLRVLRKANFDQAGSILGAANSALPELVERIPTALRERRSK